MTGKGEVNEGYFGRLYSTIPQIQAHMQACDGGSAPRCWVGEQGKQLREQEEADPG